MFCIWLSIGHTTLHQHLINVDSVFWCWINTDSALWHWINVESDIASMLIQKHIISTVIVKVQPLQINKLIYGWHNFIFQENYSHSFYSSQWRVTKAPHEVPTLGCRLLLENLKSKRGIIMSKKTLRVTCPTGMGSPFDSKQLVWFSSKHLQ